LEFEQTLATPPPDWRHVAFNSGGQFAFIASPESGLLRTANGEQFQEYLLGGEYEQRLSEYWEDDFRLEDLEGVEEAYIDW
jgi:hypothetical protein